MTGASSGTARNSDAFQWHRRRTPVHAALVISSALETIGELDIGRHGVAGIEDRQRRQFAASHCWRSGTAMASSDASCAGPVGYRPARTN